MPAPNPERLLAAQGTINIFMTLRKAFPVSFEGIRKAVTMLEGMVMSSLSGISSNIQKNRAVGPVPVQGLGVDSI